MKELFDFIKAKINADLPEYKTVRSWRNQFNRSNIDRDENAFRYPAVFIEFVTVDYDNQAIGYSDVDLIVRFHFGFESYTLSKVDDYTLLSSFNRAMFRFRGNPSDPVHFTSMQPILNLDDADDDNVDQRILEYSTKYRDLSPIPVLTEVKPVDLDLTAELVLPEQPIQNYAVKCIAANREYLTSPLGNYLPESLTDLDWEIDIISRDTGIEYFIIGAGDTDPNIELRILANDVVTLNIVFPGGLINPYSWVGAPPITSGKIGVKGTPTDIVFYFNDIEVSSTPINNTDLSDFINLDLTFNAEQFGTFYINQQNIEFKSVKLNEHEWLSPDWTAPTTTNSQGVITTLHSDVSTDAMIIEV